MGQLRGSRLEPGDPGDSQPNAGSRRRVLPGLRRVSGHSANNNQPRRRSPGRVLGPVGGHKSEFWTTPPRRDLCNRRRSQFDDFASPGNIIAVPRTRGYRIVTAYGEIIPRGRPDVSTLCGGRLSNCTGYPANPPYSQPIVGVAATPSGAGLWALDRHGKVWAAGDGVWHGDAQHQGIPTGIAATPSGKGYYIVNSSGGVYSFGDAVFYGSTGGNGSGITGIALSIDENGKVNGYWLVGNDGGIITFGQAPFWGSTGGNNGGSRVISIVAFPGITPLDQPPRRTEGYAWVHADGGVETAGRPVDAATPH